MTTAAASEADILFRRSNLAISRLPDGIRDGAADPQPGDEGHLAPNDLNAEYYAQRASAGLIISEATQITQEGQGYVWTPGIYSEAQVEGWRKVTERGSRRGRPHFHPALACRARLACLAAAGGRGPVAPSAIPAKTQDLPRKRPGRCRRRRARCGSTEIPRIIAEYKKGRQKRQARRLRRRRDPWRQRLSDRPVPERRDQQAHRFLWRPDREPHPFRARSHGRGARGLGQGAGRHQAVAGEPC